MQLSLPPIPRNRHRFRAPLTIALLVALGPALGSLGGCDGATDTPPPKKPLDGAALTLSCPDNAFADAIGPMVRSWEARTGAKVTLARTEMTPADATDLAVIPVGRLGEWAEPGHLAPLPARFRSAEHPIRWFEFLPPYAERLGAWGEQPHAIPLTGDGFVLVYDAKRFDAAGLTPPATWEQFAAVAAQFAGRDGKPSLPPLPADSERLFDLFTRVAASFDRPAFSDKDLADRTGEGDLLAFQFALPSGQPRLRAPGFEDAAAWLAGLHATKCLPAGGADDPIAALAEGRAALALVSLDQLARLPRENGVVPARFGIANVPGAGQYFDPRRGARLRADRELRPALLRRAVGRRPRAVPAPGGRVRSVGRNRKPGARAELIGTPGLGAGPTRVGHLDNERLLLWLGYGFEEDRSKKLQNALRHYVGQTVKNPTYGLRGPDRAALTAAAGEALRKLGTGAKPGDVLAEVTGAWAALDAKAPPAALKSWRQRAAGLN